MSTRGAFGFYKNGKTIAVMIDRDAGTFLQRFMREISEIVNLAETFHSIFNSAILVNRMDNIKETLAPQDYKALKAAFPVVERYRIWDSLFSDPLYNGSLWPFFNGLRYFPDDEYFLYMSIYCEWAYIINLEEDIPVVEIHRGFNTSDKAFGRYVLTDEERKDVKIKNLRNKSWSIPTFGVEHILDYSFDEVLQYFQHFFPREHHKNKKTSNIITNPFVKYGLEFHLDKRIEDVEHYKRYGYK